MDNQLGSRGINAYCIQVQNRIIFDLEIKYP
jgi:hypothetical protein